MRSSRWAASIAAIALLSTNLSAQTVYPNGLNEDSVNPKADKEFILKVQEKMNEIRKTYKRPTVGLVLSGGGAKGAAEAGALMYIEELGIPIDLVTGTSAGGLVGGLYAMGYSPEELKELFMSQDWDVMLSDRVDDKYIPYTIKQFNSKHILSLKLGKDQKIDQSILIPSGYAYGFNVNNLFSSLAVGYEGNISFAEDLPIPYACVAADIVSCKAYNFTSGSITEAMRSTMSIPGLFAPIKTKEMVLVDGGVRNNFPADLARAMGADVVIGIELSDARPTYDGVNHLGNILGQFISMLNREVYDNNLDLADVIIKPQLDGYNMLSFNPVAVDTMVQRGYRAAAAKKEDLLILKEMIGNNNGSLRTEKKATNISKKAVKIKSISFEGLSDAESSYMFDYVDIDITKPVDKQVIDDAMGLLQARGCFSEIKYSLEGKGEPYDLVFYCTLAPINKFGFGLRGDTVEGVAFNIHYGIHANKLIGSKLELEAKLNQNFKATAKYSYAAYRLPVFNIEASYSNTNMQFRMGDSGYLNSHYQSHNELLYINAGRWKRFNFKIGVQNFANSIIGEDLMSIILDSKKKENYAGLFVQAHNYTCDDHYFPTKGVDFRFEGRYDFTSFGSIKDYKPITYLSFYYKSVLPVGSRFAIIPNFQAVANIVPQSNYLNDETSEFTILSATRNYVGGSIMHRYNRNHIPFFGISKAYLVNDFVLTGSLELRYKTTDKLYISMLGGYMNSNNNIRNFFDNTGEDLYAFATEFSYKSIVGPIKLNVHWNSINAWGAVFSIGYDF